MGVALRYSRNKQEAVEIVNDSFINVFRNLRKYLHQSSFKSWFRRIVINASIDHFRRNEKHYHSLDISHAQLTLQPGSVLDDLTADEIIHQLQKIPPSYRMVFNLYVIEGYKHAEIADKLNISEGTSKSNLSIARSKLKRLLIQEGIVEHSAPNHG